RAVGVASITFEFPNETTCWSVPGTCTKNPHDAPASASVGSDAPTPTDASSAPSHIIVIDADVAGPLWMLNRSAHTALLAESHSNVGGALASDGASTEARDPASPACAVAAKSKLAPKPVQCPPSEPGPVTIVALE